MENSREKEQKAKQKISKWGDHMAWEKKGSNTVKKQYGLYKIDKHDCQCLLAWQTTEFVLAFIIFFN